MISKLHRGPIPDMKAQINLDMTSDVFNTDDGFADVLEQISTYLLEMHPLQSFHVYIKGWDLHDKQGNVIGSIEVLGEREQLLEQMNRGD